MKKSEIREVERVEDFAGVYKVFGEKPYEEKYTEEDFKEIYEEYKALGNIYGAYVDDKCVGLIAILKGKRKGQPVEFDEDDSSLAYLADIAVLSEYRAAGLGTKLMIDALMRTKMDGFRTMYMRTLEKGESMSYGIAKKVGFEQIEGVSQMVETENIRGERQVKKNIFLSIDLNNLDKNKVKSALMEGRFVKRDDSRNVETEDTIVGDDR